MIPAGKASAFLARDLSEALSFAAIAARTFSETRRYVTKGSARPKGHGFRRTPGGKRFLSWVRRSEKEGKPCIVIADGAVTSDAWATAARQFGFTLFMWFVNKMPADLKPFARVFSYDHGRLGRAEGDGLGVLSPADNYFYIFGGDAKDDAKDDAEDVAKDVAKDAAPEPRRAPPDEKRRLDVYFGISATAVRNLDIAPELAENPEGTDAELWAAFMGPSQPWRRDWSPESKKVEARLAGEIRKFWRAHPAYAENMAYFAGDAALPTEYAWREKNAAKTEPRPSTAAKKSGGWNRIGIWLIGLAIVVVLIAVVINWGISWVDGKKTTTAYDRHMSS